MRTFIWWFGMGSLTTLSILMLQGGVRDLLYESHTPEGINGILSIGLTVLGGGLLAGCIALIFNRLR